MVGLFSWLKRAEEVDYEKLLSGLEDEIRKTELALSTLTIRERKHLFNSLFYPLTVYVVVVAVYLIYPSFPNNRTWGQYLMSVGPVVLGPPIIVVLRSFLKSWYAMTKRGLIMELEKLTKMQMDKIEEMKKKTAYYMTKGLIEKYESPKKTPMKEQKSLTLPNKAVNPKIEQVKRVAQPSPLKSPMKEQSEPLPPKPIEPPQPPSWLDKVLDAIVGDGDGPQNKYALVCEECFTHNGLSSNAAVVDI
ncbi:hypothetical protein EDD86DRAFT_245545 [Gorgonomyces haynaldii]|nr:hypothetical protein EDD86DRAFT_245545 [Gorgonomyces haynaldii]